MKRILVAMSGGVDSSVAAALLKKQGFKVVGAFMRFEKKGNRCCSSDSEKMARLICSKLEIPFYVLDFTKEFKKEVINYFISEYKAGKTPNPCVVCNKKIKFNLLLKKADKLRMDYIATGHYAISKNGRLFASKDKDKDQSYFLWQLSKNTLKRTIFPLGELTKPEVRKLAKKFYLPVYNTPDSQEACFVKGTLDDFLKEYIKGKKVIADKKGKKIGQTEGFFTIGQRKGLGLSGGPYYVVSKDKNKVIVSNNEKDLLLKEFSIKNVNWISKQKLPLKAAARIRYRHKPAKATVYKNKVVFDKKEKAITPGQSAVFYIKNELIGGAIIV